MSVESSRAPNIAGHPLSTTTVRPSVLRRRPTPTNATVAETRSSERSRLRVDAVRMPQGHQATSTIIC